MTAQNSESTTTDRSTDDRLVVDNDADSDTNRLRWIGLGALGVAVLLVFVALLARRRKQQD